MASLIMHKQNSMVYSYPGFVFWGWDRLARLARATIINVFSRPSTSDSRVSPSAVERLINTRPARFVHPNAEYSLFRCLRDQFLQPSGEQIGEFAVSRPRLLRRRIEVVVVRVFLFFLLFVVFYIVVIGKRWCKRTSMGACCIDISIFVLRELLELLQRNSLREVDPR